MGRDEMGSQSIKRNRNYCFFKEEEGDRRKGKSALMLY